MANNQYVNKVEFGNQVLMDVSDTTANTSDVLYGKKFYTASGAPATGTLAPGTFTIKQYDFTELSFSAGAVGTRGVQKSIDIASHLNAYGELISLFIVSIYNSAICHFQAYQYSQSIYLNGYRAGNEAMSNNRVTVRATYMKS